MTQQNSLQAQGTIPPFATALAATHHLGTPIAHYKNGFFWEAFRDSLLVCLGLLLIAILRWGFNYGALMSALFGVVLISYAINRLFKAFPNRHINIYLCSEGLMRTNGDTVEGMRWDQVKSVVKRYRQSFFSNSSPSTYYTPGGRLVNNSDAIDLSRLFATNAPRYTVDAYVLHSSDGKEVVFDSIVSKFKQLGKVLEQTMITTLMPSMLASYQAGHPITFDTVTINSQHLLLNDGQTAIPWANINSVERNNDYNAVLIDWQPPNQQYSETERIQIRQVPNEFLFLPLIQHIRATWQPS